MENKLLILSLCILPSLILMLYIYIKDKIEKEPLYLLLTLFIGGIISAIISSSISHILKIYFPFLKYNYIDMSLLQRFIKSFFVVAFVEEFSKWIINFICTWKNKNFNHIFDSIVYSVFISLGFATFENILYGCAFSSYGIIPILLRGIISVPCHASFGVFMGYYLGIAKDQNNKKYIILSVISPILLHFIYNILLLNKVTYTYFIIFVLIIYVSAYFKIKKLNSIKKLIKKR